MSFFVNNETNFLSEGVRLMFFSTLAFSLANVFVKQVGHLPTMEIVFFRCITGVLFCYVGLSRANADWRGSNRTMLFLRGLFGTTALYLFFLTVQNIPLASAMTIQYLSPIFTTIIAIFLLKENVKHLQWLFYGLAFLGVLLIERFDARVSFFFLILGIISAFCSGVAYNLVRSLREKEHPLTVVMHFQLVGVVVGGIFTLFEWRTPVGWDWFYLLLIGAFSQLGQWFLTNSLQKEKAASVAIVNYSGLIYALFIGWFVFGELQTLESLLGMFLVVCGVILSIIYSRRQRDVEKIESTAG
ncbi:MAG: DMT family transporter [Acidobacteriota bacterium]|nr:DMT family transporter [Acidobacteriota bacterium]